MPDRKQRIPLPNFTAVPNVLIDEVLPQISPAEAKVLLYLCRATFGYQRLWTDSRFTSLTQIAAATGLHRNGVIQALKGLHSWGVVAWRVDQRTGAKSYSLRIEDEGADQSQDAASTLSVPGVLVHSVDQTSTLSVPGGVHSVDPLYKETTNKGKQDRGGSSTAAATPRLCLICQEPLGGLDLRYRYCSPACKATAEERKRGLAAEGAAAAEANGRDPRVGEVMRLYQQALGYRPSPWEANAAAAKGMLGEGYPPAAIMAGYAAAKEDPYWQTRPLSLMSLRKQIGHLLAGGKVPGYALVDGAVAEVAAAEQRKSRRGTDQQNAYAAQKLAALRQQQTVLQGAG